MLSNDGTPQIVPERRQRSSYSHRMQLWNDFTGWLTDPSNEPLLFAIAVLFIGIVVSGLIAAWIARGTVRGVLARTDRQQKASAIAALVDAATEASVWNSLTPGEQVLSDRAVGQADIQVRLLPIKGAGVAANWASHQLAEMKRNSATFGYQLDPVVAEFRDRLIEWQNKPGRAKRIFAGDLERWRFESSTPDAQLDAEQEKWVARQHHEKHASAAATATPATATPATAAPAPTAQPTGTVDTPTQAMPLPTAPSYLHRDEQEPERYTA
ncbi:hypothetical protein GCM10022286_06950 [Gryllotalpicola daejeonensis]|uniref:DUF4760 domain-containing protein n=2 Tax=Gryllotalpicola daejeonensis TaxID=993087 RepID=A0ABP7ZIL5_9MICO